MDLLHRTLKSLSGKSRVEAPILWRLKTYPLSFMDLILQVRESDPGLLERKLAKLGCRDIEHLPIIRGFYLLCPQSRIRDILNQPFLKFLSLNHKVFALGEKTSNGSSGNIINTSSYTGKNIVIAHLDTGIHPHKDLIHPRNRIVFFKDFIHNQTSPYDDHGHGSHCAGIISGSGVLSKGEFKGIAPNSLLIGVKCLDEGGTGDVRTTLKALQWVLDNRVKHKIQIVHLPLGINYSYSLNNDPLVKAVSRLWKEGLLVVSSAGNSGPSKVSITTPACAKDIITVGCNSDFSSRGPTMGGFNKPDLLAPGININSINNNTSPSQPPYISYSGTSMASSMVTGAIALLLEKYPDLDPQEVKLALEMSCKSLHLEKNIQGKGMLDLNKLLSLALR